MSTTCSTCVYWGPPRKGYHEPVPEGWKTCQREALRRPRRFETETGFYADAEYIMKYDDGYYAKCELLTGPGFGCIHHEAELP